MDNSTHDLGSEPLADPVADLNRARADLFTARSNLRVAEARIATKAREWLDTHASTGDPGALLASQAFTQAMLIVRDLNTDGGRPDDSHK